MDIINLLINFLIIIILIFGYFLIKNLIPSYFGEKGRNLATKEDIEEITEKVKTVESQINIITGNILEYSTLKRQYIIEYFASYNNWERIITSAEFDASENSEEINRNTISRIYNAKHSYNLKEGEIELFIEDNDFYKLRTSLTLKTLEYQHEFEKTASKINYLVKQKLETTEFYEELGKLKSEYHKFNVSKLKEIYPERNKLIEKLSEFIKDLMKKN